MIKYVNLGATGAPVEESLRLFDILVQQGKVLYISVTG
jgi:aryl-alcohol dehydrogenase-like predicted oxidoreductase